MSWILCCFLILQSNFSARTPLIALQLAILKFPHNSLYLQNMQLKFYFATSVLVHHNHYCSIFSNFSFISKNETLSVVRDLVVSIFTTLTELLRPMPLSVRAAGGRICPPFEQHQNRVGGRNSWEHTHPSTTKVI